MRVCLRMLRGPVHEISVTQMKNGVLRKWRAVAVKKTVRIIISDFFFSIFFSDPRHRRRCTLAVRSG